MALEYGLNGICIKHDVRIGRVVIHVGVKLPTVAILERIAKIRVSAHPVAQLYDRGLVRGEVDEAVPGEDYQYIKIIGQFPIHPVGLAVRSQIWRIYDEHHALHVLLTLKHLLLITGGNGQPIEIVFARRIIHSLDVVV